MLSNLLPSPGNKVDIVNGRGKDAVKQAFKWTGVDIKWTTRILHFPFSKLLYEFNGFFCIMNKCHFFIVLLKVDLSWCGWFESIQLEKAIWVDPVHVLYLPLSSCRIPRQFEPITLKRLDRGMSSVTVICVSLFTYHLWYGCPLQYGCQWSRCIPHPLPSKKI